MKYSIIFSLWLWFSLSAQADFGHDHSEDLELPADIITAMGGWSGNGGGGKLLRNNIWFLGDAVIPYCIQRSEDFFLSQTELETIVANSWQKWRDFFQKYKLAGRTISNPLGNNLFQFPDGIARKMSLQTRKVECSAADLTDPGEKVVFLFGLENSIVSLYKNTSAESALGIAIRKKYDHKSYRNGGFVWISNFTSSVKQFEHLLLHELGHVFGMHHNSTFVMNENIDLEFQHHANQENYFARIESRAWPYRLQMNEEVLLSFHLKRRVLGPKQCAGREFVSARTIPPEINQKLNIRPRDCVRISVSLDRFLPVKKKLLMSFKITVRRKPGGPRQPPRRGGPRPPRLEHFSFQGEFSARKEPGILNDGPGIFSKFINSNTNKEMWRRLAIDRKQLAFPLKGSFVINGKHYPAQMNQERGLSMDIFMNGRKDWWDVGSRFLKNRKR